MKLYGADILPLGLEWIGYDEMRQKKMRSEKVKESYFKSCFGHSPETIALVYNDLCMSDDVKEIIQGRPDLKYMMMMVNWLKEAVTFNSLGGRWKLHPDTVAKWCWVYARAVEALYAAKVSSLLSKYAILYITTN